MALIFVGFTYVNSILLGKVCIAHVTLGISSFCEQIVENSYSKGFYEFVTEPDKHTFQNSNELTILHSEKPFFTTPDN